MRSIRDAATGVPPLPARLEPWMVNLLTDRARCRELLAEHGSPVNVLDAAPLARNAAELVDAGRGLGVDVRLFYARKANKALVFVDAARDAGHGVDVASLAELAQTLDRGVPGERIIVSAAIKGEALLELAVASGACISLDNADELALLTRVADRRRARVAPRIAVPGLSLASRFGLPVDEWTRLLADSAFDLVGVHAHLHGYAAADRVAAAGEAFRLIDGLAGDWQFVDLGGGVPMSYLEDEAAWRCFWDAMAARDVTTWHDHRLGTVYPYWQAPVRAEWLRALLTSQVGGETVADGLTRRGLRLHLEPGRALLDGCGLTLADVAFTKTGIDGTGFVGLAMNRTQCRTTSDDFLVDPILVRGDASAEASRGFLVGAYCIENELILQRQITFPGGVAAGDVIAIPNTAGYFMHIVESASHQLPLARNVVHATDTYTLDAMDAEPRAGA